MDTMTMTMIALVGVVFIPWSIVLCGEHNRTVKASRQSLDRMKRLITEQVALRQQEDVPLADISSRFFPIKRRHPSSRRQHSELSVNNPDEYFQGDVDLSERQVQQIEAMLEKKRERRKIGRSPLYHRWEQSIGYDLTDSIPMATRQLIREALDVWQRNTCIRFVQGGGGIDRLEFFDGGGCSSFVGRTGGTQGISIATPGCDQVGIIAHEVGHALGAFHEQARPDQRDAIRINYDNIPLTRWNNFQPVGDNQADTFRLPYDTGSVMHYGAYGFAIDANRATISTVDHDQQQTIGQRVLPSFLDFEAINIAYDCSKKCDDRIVKVECLNGGYVNPNECDKCLCPDGLGGDRCQSVQYSECGAEITVSTTPLTITSPSMMNSRCVWLVKSNGTVFVQFFDTFRFPCDDTCDKAYVELKRDGDFRPTGYRFCCVDRPIEVFHSASNQLILIFSPDLSSSTTSSIFSARLWSNETITATRITTITTTSTIVNSSSTFPSTTSPSTFPSTTTTSPLISTSVSIVPISTTTGPIEIGCSNCLPWSAWTEPCSQQCGGCGSRRRHRECRFISSNCRVEEKRICNLQACPDGTNFLINNKFHILWRSCCVGLFRSGDNCTGLDEDRNPFLHLINSLLVSNHVGNDTIPLKR